MRHLTASIMRIAAMAMAFSLGVGTAHAVEAKSGPWRGVSVLDNAGHRWNDVTLALTEDGRSLLVMPGGDSRIPLAFVDLVVVYNGEGENITGIVLAARGDSPEAAWAAGDLASEVGTSRHAPAALVPRASSWWSGGSFAVGAGLAGGTGNWFSGTKTMAFLEGGLRAWCARNAYLHLLARTQSVGTVTHTLPQEAAYRDEYAMQSYQVLLGSSLTGPPGRSAKAMKYMELGCGVMRYGRTSGTGEDHFTRFALAGQVGVVVKTGRSLAVDVGLHAFFKPSRQSRHESGGASLGVGVALAYMR